MNAKTIHLDDETLQILVFGDETSDAFHRTAQHVETCSVCQRRLHQLAAPDEFACNVSSMLGESVSAIDNVDEHTRREARTAR